MGVGGVGLGGDGASGISWLSYHVERSRNILLLLLANINIERFLQTFAYSCLAGGPARNDKTTASTCYKLGKHERSPQ